MRQLFQYLDSGETVLIDVPAPQVRAGSLLVRTQASLVSAGTERMLVDFGRANPLQKARQQPEKVRQVLDKARTDGIAATVTAVRNQLGQPLALGYCNAGVVEAVGAGVHGLHVGDRVTSNGPHAEMVVVPANLVARIPAEEVSFEHAAFAPLAAIGLHGARLAEPTLGERFVVIGLGLVGLLTAQMLRAHGCEVLGIDVSDERVALARILGLEAEELSAGRDPVEAAQIFTRGIGADGVLITASTKSDEPARQAAQMCRKKGRIVLVGVTGMNLSRQLFYEKELSFQVSCSYGAGRYDPAYEERGEDYPLPYVRWTEGRNFEAVLGLIARGALDVAPLITHRYDFDKAPAAYELLSGTAGALGIVLRYPERAEVPDATPARVSVPSAPAPPMLGQARGVGVIGAGSYATQTLLPVLADLDVDRVVIASLGGASAGVAAHRFGFRAAASDPAEVLDDESVGAVLVVTRHDSHASLVASALSAGKAVFVEKPLAMDAVGLEQVREAWSSAVGAGPACLTVGFNRRFSPHVRRARELLAAVPGPRAMVMTVNAGALPDHHWLNNPEVGGGRLVGEGCHFVDLLRHLADTPIVDVTASPIGDGGGAAQSFTVTLRFADGSLGTVHYFANGHRRFPKERLEVFAGGRTLVVDNFKRLHGYGWPGFKGLRTRRQDKGHRGLLEAFLAAAEGRGPLPIPVEELFEVSEIVLQARDLLTRAQGGGLADSPVRGS
jgi:predicted dehydrogenase/threonine dehydrogenase-like Zn-dependent dehydrogenase